MFEKDDLEEFREYLIRRILEEQKYCCYTKEELCKKSTNDLQKIFEEVK